MPSSTGWSSSFPMSAGCCVLLHPLLHRLPHLAVDDGDRHAALFAGLRSGGWLAGSWTASASSTWKTTPSWPMTRSTGSLSVEPVDRRRLHLLHPGDRLSDRLRHCARAQHHPPTLLMMVILPFWTSFLIRVYAWIAILKPEGFLNQILLATGIISEPCHHEHQQPVYIGIVYSYLPFMVLPLYSALEKMDGTLLEAAQDLGCTPFAAFWKITFPLSLPGVIAAACSSSPGGWRIRHPRPARRLGNADGGQDALERVQFQPRLAGLLGGRHRAPAASGRADRAVPERPGARPGKGLSHENLVSLQHRLDRSRFAFLYIPILLLVIYSFNDPSWSPSGRASRPNGTGNWPATRPSSMPPG